MKTGVFSNARQAEEAKAAPIPMLKISAENVSDTSFAQYNLAQEDCGRVWSLATLETGNGQLQIEGHVPKVAILDTGAGGIILGKSFAASLPLCHPSLLIPAGAFMTASGQEERNVLKTKHALTFILAKGTTAETTIRAECLISNTDVYDVLLGMEFMGQTFGYVHPLTSEYIWYVDCKEFRSDHMPTTTARLPIKIRVGLRESRYQFMWGEITCPDDLLHAVEGDEEEPMVIDASPTAVDGNSVIAMAGAVTDPAPMLISPTFSDATKFQSLQATMTREIDTRRNAEAAARLHATYAKTRPPLNPTSEWTGGAWEGAFPINTRVERFHPSVIQNGVHVLDLFAGITCASLRMVLAAGMKVKCYTSVEIDDISRGISNEVLSKLQSEYPHQLPDSALRGHSKRLPQDITNVSEDYLIALVKNKGEVHFICGGWQCQSMSMAGPRTGMQDKRFPTFLNLVKIINILQRMQVMAPIYCVENTWPGPTGQKEGVDKTADLIQAFIGAPIIVDAAGLGSAAHRLRHYWTNFCEPSLLQNAMPRDIVPFPSLTNILDKDHIAFKPLVASRWPFVQHTIVGHDRFCLPTIVTYPGSFAFRRRVNGTPGEGQLWDKTTHNWIEPTLREKEQLMGYRPDDTMGGLATDKQRAERLGQAMDGNTSRWMGAFLSAAHTLP